MINFNEMDAGREMDALVAERVIGLVACKDWILDTHEGEPNWYSCCSHGIENCYPSKFNHPKEKVWSDSFLIEYLHEVGGPPHYSTNKGAAHVLLHSWEGDYEVARHNGQYICNLYEPSSEWHGYGTTFELAVCRARLKATARG